MRASAPSCSSLESILSSTGDEVASTDRWHGMSLPPSAEMVISVNFCM
eukprot:CAMPEP_0195050110 /NCGR_PEP_ID=MMETSP0347-20130606/63734_1 /TAXON_ID=2932 /ORGANISM="Alexandrium fundyense, Strain CCMP1719" /LENGTH=47 /DNA_ID= /DNA_START= /DNA_END= /DNA_ORIENTATION=